ncbi:MAG: 3'-5' exonuclease, partial [Candidatus Nanoarchaeia archaeon]
SYKEFIDIVVLGLQHIGFDVATFLSHYFTPQERAGKEQRQLFFSFLYDFRAILESYMGHHQEKDFFTQRINQAKLSQQLTAQNLLKLAFFVHETLEERSLRTFADQLVDVNRLYDLHTNIIPSFQWVLVDEYQDVNPEQLRLLGHLDPQNLFCVGDPRQSIFAWRGSHPGIIYDFIDDDTTVVELTTNFRSASQIISFSNQLIAQTNKGKHSFSPLQAHTKDKGRVFVTSFTNEQEEAKSIIQQIKELACQRNEIFILSRTNKGLEPYKQLCEQENIAHIMRTDEKKDAFRTPRTDEITLSTVHAIKGLEAEFVFVVGVNFKNYPCKSKDHRFVELLCTKNNYDQFEEERRLLYVACTRAKKELYVSYSLGLSPFITRRVLQESSSQQSSIDRGTQKKAINTDNLITQRSALRRWRFLEAQQRNIPPYLIFTDKTLESLLELQPLSVDELLEVSGLGKRKVEEFGQDILHIMYA